MPEALERITLGSPDTPKYTSERHIAAYEFASKWVCEGETVLDLACDTGKALDASRNLAPAAAKAALRPELLRLQSLDLRVRKRRQQQDLPRHVQYPAPIRLGVLR